MTNIVDTFLLDIRVIFDYLEANDLQFFRHSPVNETDQQLLYQTICQPGADNYTQLDTEGNYLQCLISGIGKNAPDSFRVRICTFFFFFPSNSPICRSIVVVNFFSLLQIFLICNLILLICNLILLICNLILLICNLISPITKECVRKCVKLTQEQNHTP